MFSQDLMPQLPNVVHWLPSTCLEGRSPPVFREAYLFLSLIILTCFVDAPPKLVDIHWQRYVCCP